MKITRKQIRNIIKESLDAQNLDKILVLLSSGDEYSMNQGIELAAAFGYVKPGTLETIDLENLGGGLIVSFLGTREFGGMISKSKMVRRYKEKFDPTSGMYKIAYRID